MVTLISSIFGFLTNLTKFNSPNEFPFAIHCRNVTKPIHFTTQQWLCVLSFDYWFLCIFRRWIWKWPSFCTITSGFQVILTWKCENHDFWLYLSIDNFANFYYFLNMRKRAKKATFQLSISLFTCIIFIFLTGDIADRKKKLQVSQWPIYGDIWILSFFPAIYRSLWNLQFFFSIGDISG